MYIKYIYNMFIIYDNKYDKKLKYLQLTIKANDINNIRKK